MYVLCFGNAGMFMIDVQNEMLERTLNSYYE